MIELEKLEDFVSLGGITMNQESTSELYLTECDYCCSHGASYRLFNAVPRFFDAAVTPHPDSGINEEIMVAKTYNQRTGLIDRIARSISTGATDIAGQMGTPINAKIRKLK